MSSCPHPQNHHTELAKRGFKASLAKGDGYFYFADGEAADWLGRTVRVPTLHALTLDQWIGEFQKLAEKNRQVMGKAAKSETSRKAKVLKLARTKA